MNYQISEETISALLTYLEDKPLKDVVVLIVALNDAKPVIELVKSR